MNFLNKYFVICFVVLFILLETISIYLMNLLLGSLFTFGLVLAGVFVGLATIKSSFKAGRSDFRLDSVNMGSFHVVIIGLLLVIPGFFSDLIAISLAFPQVRQWIKVKLYPLVISKFFGFDAGMFANMANMSSFFGQNGANPFGQGSSFGSGFGTSDLNEELSKQESYSKAQYYTKNKYNGRKNSKSTIEDAEFSDVD